MPSALNRVLAASALCLALVSMVCTAGVANGSTQSGDLVVRGGHRFDTESGEFRPNRAILIQDGRFVSLDGEQVAPEGCPELVLGDDDYILPGLVDCHAHYNVRFLRRRREEFTVMPIQYLANGATVTFSCGEYDPEGMMQLRKDIESGAKIGPHLLNSGPYFGTARRPWHADPEQVRSEVDFWASQGVGGFKAKLIDPESLRALIEQAHKHDLSVTAHLDSGFRNSVNPSTAIDMDIDRIEHFLGGDAMTADQPAYSTLAGITADMPEFQAIAKKFVDTGTVFDATITAYGYGSDDKVYEHWFDESSILTPFVREEIRKRQERRPPEPPTQFIRIFETKRANIDDFFRAGGTITLGTDHVSDGSYLPGFGVHREMHALSSAGIPNADVLRIATVNGARALGIDKDFGSISPGKWGDLAIVTGNPIEDIRRTRTVRYVVRAGNLHETAKLLESIQGKLGPESGDTVDEW
jgi:imidazolonepropionase-like amidohydrolase